MVRSISLLFLVILSSGCQIIPYLEREAILPRRTLIIGEELPRERRGCFLHAYFTRSAATTLVVVEVEVGDHWFSAGQYVEGETIEEDRIYLYANWFPHKPPQRTLLHEYLHAVWFRILTADQRRTWEEQWERRLSMMQRQFPQFMLYNLPKPHDAMESWADVGAALVFGDRDLDPGSTPPDLRAHYCGILREAYLDLPTVSPSLERPRGQN